MHLYCLSLLLKNAFKYVGGSDEKENSVNISFQREDNILLFKVCNTKETNNKNCIKHKGIGIDNAKRRLVLLYPEKCDLAINENEHLYEVILKLQLT